MPAPHEVVAAPYAVYLSPVGTAMPLVSAVPVAPWVLLGTSGTKSYDEEGVTVQHPQTIEVFRPAGGTGPRKAFRTEEDLIIGLTVVDLLPANYAKILNNAAVTSVAAASGIPGYKHFPTLRGLEVKTFALVAQGMSPFDNTMKAQYEVTTCYEGASPEPVHTKGTPAGLACEFYAIETDSNGFGRWVAQDAAPL